MVRADQSAARDHPVSDDEVIRLAARTHENDRYLSALLAPRRHQPALIALAAFQGELARIPGVVNEPMMGEIRFQWWRDALEACGRGERSGHPVADAVGAAEGRYGLPRGLLLGLIDARAGELHEVPVADDLALRTHLAKTEGAGFALALHVLIGPDAVRGAGNLIRAASQAYGLVRLIRELPIRLAERRILLPASRLAVAGITVDELMRGEASSAVMAPLFAGMLSEARRALGDARTRWDDLPRAGRTALLPLALVEPHLRVFESVRNDLHREVVDILPLTRVIRLWWLNATGRL